jgi:hypothetical protein
VSDEGPNRRWSQNFFDMWTSTLVRYVHKIRLIIQPSSVEAEETYERSRDRLQAPKQRLVEAISKFLNLTALNFMTLEARRFGWCLTAESSRSTRCFALGLLSEIFQRVPLPAIRTIRFSLPGTHRGTARQRRGCTVQSLTQINTPASHTL